MLIDQCTWCHDTRYSPCILWLSLCLCRSIVEILVTNSDMFVEVLDENLQVPVQLVCGEACLTVSVS